MLELFILYWLGRKLSAIAKMKGRSGSWGWLGPALWVTGEILGFGVAFASAQDEMGAYIIALVCAASGGAVAYLIVNSLPSAQPAQAPPIPQHAAPAAVAARPDAQPAATPQVTAAWNPPPCDDPNEHVLRCLTPEFIDQAEERRFSEPGLAPTLDALNAGRTSDAIVEAQNALPAYRDFDLPYKWMSSAYRQLGRIDWSLQVAESGLAISRRKSQLLDELAESSWHSGNLCDAVYAWAQALHAQGPSGSDETPYLMLSYVADALGLTEVSAALLRRVDAMRPGQVRLGPSAATELFALGCAEGTDGMRTVLGRLAETYAGGAAPIGEAAG